ncbi:MAG: hypothetical protein JWM76_1405 [Pseudonocardiales bacterium]|nr:hypothetical protein [Pseudonocardiales bacterium]
MSLLDQRSKTFCIEHPVTFDSPDIVIADGPDSARIWIAARLSRSAVPMADLRAFLDTSL